MDSGSSKSIPDNQNLKTGRYDESEVEVDEDYPVSLRDINNSNTSLYDVSTSKSSVYLTQF